MSLDELVLSEVQQNPCIALEQLNAIIARKVKTSLNHWRAKGRIVTEDGVSRYPFRYRTAPITIKRRI